MKQKTIIGLVVAGFLLVGGAWFLFTGTDVDTNGIEDVTRDGTDVVTELDRDGRFAYIERIEAVQFYGDGAHTFVGEVDMPTPCDLLEVDAIVMESMPEQIRLEFRVINEDIDDEIACAQVITPQRFMVEVSASREASISASFMGVPIEINLREPQPGETPDDFELFIKG